MAEETKPEDKDMTKEVIRLEDSDDDDDKSEEEEDKNKGDVSSKKEDTSKAPQPWSDEELTDLRKWDVIIGRGGGSHNYHPGHVRLRELVWVTLPFYEVGSTIDKTALIDAIVVSFHSFGGRFLESRPKTKTEDARYRLADTKGARNKVASGIRDALAPDKVQLYNRLRRERQQIKLQPRQSNMTKFELQEFTKLLQLAGSVAPHREDMGPQSVVEREIIILGNKMMIAGMNGGFLPDGNGGFLPKEDESQENISTEKKKRIAAIASRRMKCVERKRQRQTMTDGGPAVPNNSKRIKPDTSNKRTAVDLANEHRRDTAMVIAENLASITRRGRPGDATDVDTLRIELARKQQEHVAVHEHRDTVMAVAENLASITRRGRPGDATDVDNLRIELARKQQEQVAVLEAAEMEALHWKIVQRRQITANEEAAEIETLKRKMAIRKEQAAAEEAAHITAAQKRLADCRRQAAAAASAEIADATRKLILRKRETWAATTRKMAAETPDWTARVEGSKNLAATLKGQAVYRLPASAEQRNDLKGSITTKPSPNTGDARALEAKERSRQDVLLAYEASALRKKLAAIKQDQVAVDSSVSHEQRKSIAAGKHEKREGASRSLGAKKLSGQETLLANEMSALRRKLTALNGKIAVDSRVSHEPRKRIATGKPTNTGASVSHEQRESIAAGKPKKREGTSRALGANKLSGREKLLANEMLSLRRKLTALKEKTAVDSRVAHGQEGSSIATGKPKNAGASRVLEPKKLSAQEELLAYETSILQKKLAALKQDHPNSISVGKLKNIGASRSLGAKKRSRQEERLEDDITTLRSMKRKLAEGNAQAAVDLLPIATKQRNLVNTDKGEQHAVAVRMEGATKQLSQEERCASKIGQARSQLVALKAQSCADAPIATKRHNSASDDIVTLANKAEEEHPTVAARVKQSTCRPRDEECPALPETQLLPFVTTDDISIAPEMTSGEHSASAVQDEDATKRDLHEVPATELRHCVTDDNVTPTTHPAGGRRAHTVQDEEATKRLTQEDSQETEHVLLGTCGQDAGDRPVATEQRKLKTNDTTMSTLTAAGAYLLFATKEKGSTSRPEESQAVTQRRSTTAGWQQDAAELMSTSNPVEMFIETKSDKHCPSEEAPCYVKSSSAVDAELQDNDEPQPEIVSSSDSYRSSTTRASDDKSQIPNLYDVPSDPQPSKTNSLTSSNSLLKTTSDSKATMATGPQSLVFKTRELPQDRPPQQKEKRIPSRVVWNRLMKHTKDHAVLIRATMLHLGKLSASQTNSLHMHLQRIASTLSACNDIWKATSSQADSSSHGSNNQDKILFPLNIVRKRLMKHTADHAMLVETTIENRSALSAAQQRSLTQEILTIASNCDNIWKDIASLDDRSLTAMGSR